MAAMLCSSAPAVKNFAPREEFVMAHFDWKAPPGAAHAFRTW
jgi:hypothetical protein